MEREEPAELRRLKEGSIFPIERGHYLMPGDPDPSKSRLGHILTLMGYYGKRIRDIMQSDYSGNTAFRFEVAVCFEMVYGVIEYEDFLFWAQECSGMTEKAIMNYVTICGKFLSFSAPHSVFYREDIDADFNMEQLTAMKGLSVGKIMELLENQEISYFSTPGEIAERIGGYAQG